MFSIVCAVVIVTAIVLFFFAHPEGQNDDNFMSYLRTMEESGVRPLYNSKDLQYLIQYISSLDILLGTHL